MEACNYKAHAVCIPCPLQGHIMPMFKLAKLLHHRGVYITFVNTEFNHRRFLKSLRSAHVDDDDDDDGAADESLRKINGIPSSFRFETIPDGHEAAPNSDDHNANQDTKSIWQSIQNYSMFRPFLDLLAKLNDASHDNTNSANNPPVTCIISEAFMPFTVKAAQQLGLPVAMFFPIAATNLKHFIYTLAPQNDDESSGPTNENHEMHKNCFRPTDIKDIMSKLVKEAAENVSKASAVLIQIFDALEQAALDDISSRVPHLLTLGPLQLLLDHMKEQDPLLNTIDYNILWKKDTECLEWLDSKEPNSVIYVSFGGSGLLTKQQLIEVGMGLANSNRPFLWVIRPDLVVGDTTDLPSEFKAKAKENGFVASWCPQEQVLDHPAVGGFFTHCGWNSTMESLSAGVPMICWPFIADQPANCRIICGELGVGIEINSGEEVNRENIEKLVKELMGGEKGQQMRKKAMKWKRLAEEAVAPDGSSSRNLEKLVNKILVSKHSQCYGFK